MKIDIHTHTKKCKSGDAPTREISAQEFCEVLASTDVGIIAITNHNVFDLDQFKQIENLIDGDIQVWPGVELDVVDVDGGRGHLLVIVSPRFAKEFDSAVYTITENSTPDDFTATIAEVVQSFDELRPLYVAHYKKMPKVSDAAIEDLESRTNSPELILKEVSNSISAGIYISHGYASIYGTDIHDWGKYRYLSAGLPDLRLPVDSFEHFCLLLKKDPTTINTLLDRKTSEQIDLRPFPDDTMLSLTIFNDINVVFGPKGTGKSCILQAIARHYSESGVDTYVYESASDKLDEIFDLKGKDLSIDLNGFGINYCTNEIEELRNSREIDVTSLGKYQLFFESKRTNKNAKKIRIKDIAPEDNGRAKRDFIDYAGATKKVAELLRFISESLPVKNELSDKEYSDLEAVLSSLVDRLAAKEWMRFLSWKEISLMNTAIEKIRAEVARKTGQPALPTTTGFRSYALNRMKVELHAGAIVRGMNTKIPPVTEDVGSLGTSKGVLAYRTEFIFQDGSISDSSWASLSKVKKTPQKQFASCVLKILEHSYSSDLFQIIADLNEIEDVEGIKTVYELLLFKRYFSLGGLPYSPSSGEASMVMLQKELGVEKDVYILDEPERSLGNEYISDVIVPMIKERARAGKVIFISTHDANIAVRTLPYSSIYRCHGDSGYSTYAGNPFTSDLVSLDDETDRLDWKEISMRTLEGGEEAFGERGSIYGSA
jgi:predicted ATPase